MRIPAALLGAVLITGLAPAVAFAAPANDDFGSATEITALPFRTTIDTTGATRVGDDPYPCETSHENSVWLRYTAPAAGIVRLSVRGATNPAFAIFTGERGALTPLPGGCSTPSPYEDTFHVEAGKTYHFMVSDRRASDVGLVQVGLTAMSPEPNDNRAAARVTSLPAVLEGDLRRSTAEPGEAPPSCNQAATRSLWYRYTATKTRHVSLLAGRAAITVHRGNDAAELDCVPMSILEGAAFHAVQGETYLIRVADLPQWAETFQLEVGTAGAIAPQIHLISPSEQPVGAEFEFYVSSGDMNHKPLVSGTATLGDGSSVPFVGEQRIKHRYAQAGVYEVRVTGSTQDGRSGTGSVKVSVK
ncbi:PKD domain-containing protein [Lentzea alba]|uniref:PKD domain-containing protein n=1 Tax=Lentzea alba TaxID=2714351 RepID=UPI0039BFC971